MDNRNKQVFWEALIIALFIFGLGIFLGYLMEANRIGTVANAYESSEINLLDIQAQSELFSLDNLSCVSSINETINFANRIYDEAKTLEKYEGANKLGQGIVEQHKKYDVLRVLLFSNALKIKERCNQTINTVVYFYDYQSQDVNVNALQNVFSKKLLEVRIDKGDNVILIPIAGNINSNSIGYLRQIYNITSLPAILINENTKIETIEQLKDIEKYLK